MASTSLASFETLVKKVRETFLVGQQKIEEERVLTYWKAGKLIKEHLLHFKDRADYGKFTIRKLAKNLELTESVLWRTLRFAEEFPILAARQQLTWAHYRALITVPDLKKREALERQAAKEGWTSRDLEIEVRNENWSKRVESNEGKSPVKLTVPELGNFYTYKIIRPEIVHSKSNELLIDLGLSITIELNRFADQTFKPETFVHSVKDAKGNYSIQKSSSATLKNLYTYQAFVEKVIDGDTLKVEIDLGFNTRIREIIRLKSIDCPELDTPEGKSAKNFVETQLEAQPFITIKTTRADKYRRYLGEVFFSQKAQPVFLNQLLLDKGHAVRVRD
jgi:endonuclease YncB( thermonuclease family)